jgi:hypothetical protein
VAIPLEKLAAITTEFLNVKQRFFPAAAGAGWTHLGRVLLEVKGAELRRDAISPSRRKRRHVFGFLDNFVRLLREYDARVFARVWVKGLATPIDSTAIYTYSVQDICSTFQAMLFEKDRRGFVIADSRNKSKNEKVAHSIFTQKHGRVGVRNGSGSRRAVQGGLFFFADDGVHGLELWSTDGTDAGTAMPLGRIPPVRAMNRWIDFVELAGWSLRLVGRTSLRTIRSAGGMCIAVGAAARRDPRDAMTREARHQYDRGIRGARAGMGKRAAIRH